MKKLHTYTRGILIIIFVMIFQTLAQAQSIDSLQLKIDSLRNRSNRTAIDTSVSAIIKKTESVTLIINNIKEILRRGFDTSLVESSLPEAEMYIQNIQYGFQQNQQMLNLRHLNIIKSILLNYNQQLKKWQELLVGYTTEMMQINSKLHLIIQDSTFAYLPHDTLISNTYKTQLLLFTDKWSKADSSNKAILNKIENLQTRVANAYLTSTELINETSYRIKNFNRQIGIPEENPIWQKSIHTNRSDFIHIIQQSLKIASKIYTTYIQTKRTTLLIILLITLLAGMLTRALVKKLSNKSAVALNEHAPTIVQFPIAAIILIVGAISPFFSQEEPASFTFILWLLVTILYTYLFIKNKTIQLNAEWMAMIILFIIFSCFNLLIQSTQAERWIHLVLVIVSLLLGISIFIKYEQINIAAGFPVRLVILIYIGLNTFALIFNIIGNFILAKYFAASAITGLLSARILYSIITLIMETIWIYEAEYRNTLMSNHSADLDKLNKNLKKVITLLVSIVWLIILSRNLNAYDLVFDAVSEFLQKERMLGSIHFSFYSILIFVGIIWISNVIAKALQLIFGDTGIPNTPYTTKVRGGSLLLLAKIAILSLGIVLAFLASGIPIDKLTIIVGALGVGIGFGLQNVVNNLVSGLILAFERPVSVGDTIEISNRLGIVKEIGIRSTKILTPEGSEVIIPNGDLLSQHIINWTQNSAFRRVELLLGVSYQCTLEEVNEILLSILAKHPQVQQWPTPQVLTHLFADSAVQLRILFWTGHENWLAVKSDILQEIHKQFKEKNISIPYPQQDIHIISDSK